VSAAERRAPTTTPSAATGTPTQSTSALSPPSTASRAEGQHHDRPAGTIAEHRWRLTGAHGPHRGNPDRRHDHGDRDQPEEHPAPPERLSGDLGRQQRRHQRRHHPRGRHDREHAGPQHRGEAPATQTYATAGTDAGAEPLQEPAGDQHRHRRREPADDQTAQEHAPRPASAPTGATRSAVRPADHDADERAQVERREDPAVEPQVAEVGLDERHDRADRHRLGRDHRDQQTIPTSRQSVAGSTEALPIARRGSATPAPGPDGLSRHVLGDEVPVDRLSMKVEM
jgi:hypothetical protein